MSREFLGQRASSAGRGVHRVVNGHLSVLVVQPGVNVLATLLQDFLPQNDRRGRRIREEVVFGNRAVVSDRGSAVVTEVEYARLDSEPGLYFQDAVSYWRVESSPMRKGIECRWLERLLRVCTLRLTTAGISKERHRYG